MTDDLKKGPPPLPKDAFKKPSIQAAPMESPWDEQVIASVPPPTPTSPEAEKLKPPSWMGRPVTSKDHLQDLETEAAINEFGPSRMPRGQAEEHAYKGYVQKQHTEAAAHHLAGMRAAHASGDMESARKHSLMYGVHSKALGHDPVGPAHPSVAAHLEGNPGKVKFKPHRGDLFAIQKPPEAPVIASSPPPGLGKALHAIWERASALVKNDVNSWAKSELAARKAKAVPCICTSYKFPHRHGSGKCGSKK